MPAPTAISQTLKIRRRRAFRLVLTPHIAPDLSQLAQDGCKGKTNTRFSKHSLAFHIPFSQDVTLHCFVCLAATNMLPSPLLISNTSTTHVYPHAIFPMQNTLLEPAFTGISSPMLTINSPKDPSALCVSTTKTLFPPTRSQPRALTSATSHQPPYLP